jgi:prefoldin subunit 5
MVYFEPYYLFSDDLSKIMVKIGRDYFVELTQDEAL